MHAETVSTFVDPELVSHDEMEMDEVWVAFSSVLLGRSWNEHIARVAVCWAGGFSDDIKETSECDLAR